MSGWVWRQHCWVWRPSTAPCSRLSAHDCHYCACRAAINVPEYTYICAQASAHCGAINVCIKPHLEQQGRLGDQRCQWAALPSSGFNTWCTYTTGVSFRSVIIIEDNDGRNKVWNKKLKSGLIHSGGLFQPQSWFYHKNWHVSLFFGKVVVNILSFDWYTSLTIRHCLNMIWSASSFLNSILRWAKWLFWVWQTSS